MGNNSSHPRSRPKQMLVPSNLVTTWQIVNIICLGWTSLMLYIHGDVYTQSNLFTALGIFNFGAQWWTILTAGITLVNLLPMLHFWATHVNRTFKTKATGMVLAAMWWGFIGTMFLVGQGPDIGFGIFTALAVGSAHEAARLVRGRV